MVLILDFIILVLVLGAAVFYLIFIADLMFGGQDFLTTKPAILKVSQILGRYNKQSGKIYDLGSCRGNFLLKLTNYCPKLSAVGIDNSGYRIWLSKTRAWLTGKSAVFVKGDIFAANVSDADAVYIYLDKSLLKPLQDKLQKELKPGAMVITNAQSFPSWEPAQTYVTHAKKPEYEKLFVYIKE